MKYRRAYVGMIIKVLDDGSIHPLRVIWEDGKQYAVDKVKLVTPAAATRAGGRGMRYTLVIKRQERFFFEDEGRWFTEVPVYE